MAGLDVQVNQTNWYLRQQAEHLNNVTMRIYEKQMKSELLHLQSMLEYFNAEQKRLVENYISEACAVKQSILGSRPCDISVTPMLLNIPMLPCNFVPIQPQFYTGYRQAKFAVNVGQGLAPYLDAARSIACTTGYATLIIVSAMILLHLTGAVVFHFLRTRHLFPVHHVYITSTPPSANAVTLCPHHPGHITRDTDSESDDNDSGFKTYHSNRTTSRLSPPAHNADTMQRFSETKV